MPHPLSHTHPCPIACWHTQPLPNCMLGYTPPPYGQTHTCENITFLQLRLLAVIILNCIWSHESPRCMDPGFATILGQQEHVYTEKIAFRIHKTRCLISEALSRRRLALLPECSKPPVKYISHALEKTQYFSVYVVNITYFIFLSISKAKGSYYRPQTKLREGIVFTGVCLSKVGWGSLYDVTSCLAAWSHAPSGDLSRVVYVWGGGGLCLGLLSWGSRGSLECILVSVVLP